MLLTAGLRNEFEVYDERFLYLTAGDGVHCFDPNGVLLGKIKVPEPVSNVAFGGPKRNRLFITGTTSLYAVYVGAVGVQRP